MNWLKFTIYKLLFEIYNLQFTGWNSQFTNSQEYTLEEK